MYLNTVKNVSPSNPRAVYIGRATANRPASPLANPFRLHHDTPQERERVQHAYRHWLWQQIKAGNAAVIDALRSLKADSILVCYCAPKPCHGHIIMKAWAWGVKEGWIDPEPYQNHDASTLGRVADAGAAAISEAQLEEWRAIQLAEIAKAAPVKTRKSRKARAAKTTRDLAAAAATVALMLTQTVSV